MQLQDVVAGRLNPVAEMGLTGGDEGKKAHLLFVPIGLHGHVIPGLRLVSELARKGIAVTCAVYDELLALLSSSDLLAEIQSLDVQFIALANPREPANGVPALEAKNVEESFKPVAEKLLHDKSSGIAGPTCVLADMFLTWTQNEVVVRYQSLRVALLLRGSFREVFFGSPEVATNVLRDLSEKLGIPFYMFVPSGAALAKMMQESTRLSRQNIIKIKPDGTLFEYEGAIDLDCLPSLAHYELTFSLRKHPDHFLYRSQVMCRVAGVVINTFYEVEKQIIDSLVIPSPLGFEENKVRKVYPVGPLYSASPKVRGIAAKNLEDSADESISWLNTQPPSSVLYVAFGTIAKLKAEEIHELALGLEGSDQRFLWVLPQRKSNSEVKTSSVADFLPKGFEARTRDRGHIITGWAPQLQILAHSATGGFLTHAGWNSCLESITIGVPMIAWPQAAEQHLNCRYLMDVCKIADRLHTGPDNILDRKEVERAVRLLMVEPEGKEMKKRVEELKRKVAEAVAEDGSTSRMIHELALDIRATVSLNAKTN